MNKTIFSCDTRRSNIHRTGTVLFCAATYPAQGLQASCSSRRGVARSILVEAAAACLAGLEGRSDTVEVRTQQADTNTKHLRYMPPPPPGHRTDY